MFSFERMLKIWEKYGHMYWNGLGYTLLFAFVSVLMGLVLGLVLASGRMASVQSRDNLAVKALKAVAKFFCTAYVEVFRATPMLVQVFIIYYGLGNVFKLPDSSLNRMFWAWWPSASTPRLICRRSSAPASARCPAARWRPRAASA